MARSGNGAEGGIIDQIANDAEIPRALPDPNKMMLMQGSLQIPSHPSLLRYPRAAIRRPHLPPPAPGPLVPLRHMAF